MQERFYRHYRINAHIRIIMPKQFFEIDFKYRLFFQ